MCIRDSLTKPSYKAGIALRNGFRLYSAIPGNVQLFEEADIKASGDINSLLDDVDVIIDTSPGKTGLENKKLYEGKGKKAIFQGGEPAEVAEASFNAHSNYDSAFGKNYVRVVSCNTTGLCRTLNGIRESFGIEDVYAVLIRRSADPGDSKKGPINAIVPVNSIPSHHGPDVKTVIPSLNIVTSAVKVPTTIMHLHIVRARLSRPATREQVLEQLRNAGRVLLVSESSGIKSTAEVMEWAREIGRKRADLFEVAVWEESVNVQGDMLYFMQAVHQESDVVPENVDAVRAMFRLMGRDESIAKTDKSLSIGV